MSNLTFVIEQALKTNQEVAAKFLTEQNRELQQIARGRQDMKQKESQPRQPGQLISRVVGDRQTEYKARTERGRKEQPYSRYKNLMVKGKYGPCGRAGSGARLFRGEDSLGSRDYENRGYENASAKGAMQTRTLDAGASATKRAP